MKRIQRLFFAAFLGAAALRVVAAPPKGADLPANPEWLLHFDCDALRRTYLGEYLLYQLGKPEIYSNIVAFQSTFGFDFRTNLHGMTVYSTGALPADYVIITYADLDAGRLVNLFKSCESPQIVTNKRHVVYSWVDKTPGKEGQRSYAAILDGRMLAAKSKKTLLAALSVVDGAPPNFSARKEVPESVGHDGAFLLAAGKASFLDSQPGAALFKLAESIKFHVAETNQNVAAALTVKAPDEDTARQMSVAAQGLVALLSLQKDTPEFARLASGIAIKQDGPAWTATLSAPSIDLITAIKAYLAKAAKQNAGPQ